MPTLLVTMGDPAGIGIEITLLAWLKRNHNSLPAFLLVGDPELIKQRAREIEAQVSLQVITDINQYKEDQDHLTILDPKTGTTAAEKTIAAIDLSVDLCLQGSADAVITNPIQKKRLYDAGFKFPGHTEYLAHLTGAPEAAAVMMFASPELMTVPATIHIPLNEVPKALTKDHLSHVIRTTHQDLQNRFGIANPSIVVAGLNPHAGEAGSMGHEEVDVITPVINDMKASGMAVSGPYPADSLFHERMRKSYDAAICMYHDQALIPIKTIDFDRGVNVTLGLAIIRTSPDHGTAEDIAGLGIANPESLIEAIRLASEMSLKTRKGA
ncbi:4-hydroxythreonine-4-phosphate dehydrogenase PdxA [Sneathiella limimaris]|uniref:4-hydroxythreonine-4-phosphate dehydrogenase PdxA n=1 Tax=Sneathiella limimaris TaxID=1964213 RepID=UPI00146A5509|nr:4-hydroxythreonine-4-phosphate dehydrogenase PdxA [Sneathiella limimaris]